MSGQDSTQVFKLIGIQGPRKGQIILLEALPCVIGRAPDCQLPIVDDNASRRHTQVFLKDGKFWVEDMKSVNGTYVNSQRKDMAQLTHGDILQVGAHVFKVEITEFVSQEPLPAAKKVYKDDANPPAKLTPLYAALGELLNSELDGAAVGQQCVKHLAHFLKAPHVQLNVFGEQTYQVVASYDLGSSAKIKPFPDRWLKKTSSPLTFVEGELCHYLFDLTYQRKNIGVLWLCLQAMPLGDLEILKSYVSGIVVRTFQDATLRHLHRAMDKLKTYVSEDVYTQVVQKEANILQSITRVEEKQATVLFCDIQGFTPMCESLSPSEIADLLNAYFKTMVEVIHKNHGEINKFIGDAIMAVFGAPISHGNDALNAVKAGLEMLEMLQVFWKTTAESKRFNIRIGINSGRMVAGTIGSPDRLEYTVLGDEVNIASRLESWSRANSITIGENTAKYVKHEVSLEKVTGVTLKGKTEKVSVYRVLGMLAT